MIPASELISFALAYANTRRFLAPLKRTQDIHVKGGTIDGVKAQAGYVKDKDGKLIAFAFITNNIIEKGENINRFYEDLLKLLL